MDINAQYLELHELLTSLLRQDLPEDCRRICVYHPDSYIALMKELVRLQEETKRLQQIEAQYAIQCGYAMSLQDKLHYIKKELDSRGIRLQIRW